MIAIDTSALVAVLQREPEAKTCADLLEADNDLIMSAGTLAEALIVARGKGIAREMAALVDGLTVAIVPVTAAVASRVADAYERWGKGHHPAKLNFGDCFAYVAAMDHDCPLLFVGGDFALTDVEPAIRS
ncbi:MAG TPA: type II toxin-antitoxin system VapC family toxin [Bosea sp. (in: a-proteobacteria)]